MQTYYVGYRLKILYLNVKLNPAFVFLKCKVCLRSLIITKNEQCCQLVVFKYSGRERNRVLVIFQKKNLCNYGSIIAH